MSSSKKINTAYNFINQATLIRGGEAYFKKMSEMISQADHSIQLQVYIFDGDTTGMQIADLLIKAAQEGKIVQVLLDGYASRNIPASLITRMRQVGIRLRFFNPLWKGKKFYFGRRLHHKILVCDGRIALVGGVNISDRYNDLPGSPGWLDWAVYTEGEAAFELHKVCNSQFAKNEKDWIHIEPEHIFKGLNKKIHCAIRIRRNDWVKNLNQISASYMEMLRQAKNEITILSSYFIPSGFFRKQMMHALKRGVKIKLILAGESDVIIAKAAERFLYQWALRNGIEIYEYKHNILHGKIAICDKSRVTLGSYNVNDISAKASIELNLDIDDMDFAESVQLELDHIITSECHEIQANHLKINWLEKFYFWICYEIYKSIFSLFTFYFKKEKKTGIPHLPG
jgi:cardiolipin synthase